jgi:hypothetical protein
MDAGVLVSVTHIPLIADSVLALDDDMKEPQKQAIEALNAKTVLEIRWPAGLPQGRAARRPTSKATK